MIRAQNHAGYTVQTHAPGLGWIDGPETFTTFELAADALRNPAPCQQERRVYEKLTGGAP